MKKFLISIFALLFLFNCTNTGDRYTINGTITNVEDGKKVTLRKIVDRMPVTVDSTTVKGEKFTLSGTVDKPDIYFLFVESAKANLPFILENANMNITAYKDSLGASVISGSDENNLIKSYSDSIKAFTLQARDLTVQYSQARKNQDTSFIKSYQAKRMEINKQMSDFTQDFAKKPENGVFGMVILEGLLTSRKINYKVAQEIYDTYQEKAKNSGPGDRLNERIEAILATEIGAVAPDFSAKDPNGNDVSLTSIKGKITIIDFWAAWCRPCRIENPNMVKLYNKYHDKGLEIIGVSLDGRVRQNNPKEAWVKAIETDSLTWHQISNLKGFNDPIAKKYNVQSIPATYVLDGEGKIIAKNLRGPALENKVAELLD